MSVAPPRGTCPRWRRLSHNPDVIARVPKISIITPCFNGLPFLPALLDSVRAQTFDAWEHIVVDDGSRDASADAVKRAMAADPRVSLIQQANGGVAAARAAGYRASNPASDYLYFLDADDLIDPAMLATMIGYLDAHPTVAVAYCGVRCIDEHDEPVPADPGPRYVPDGRGVRLMEPDEPATPLVAIYCWAPVMESVSIIRRRAYASTAGWDSTIGQPGEGVDLFTQIALHHEVHFVNRTLYTYRRHRSQASHDPERLSRQDLKVQRKWRDRMDLTSDERAQVEAAQAFRRGALRMHHHWTAARGYLRAGEIRHAMHCGWEVCRIMRDRMTGASPWPAE